MYAEVNFWVVAKRGLTIKETKLTKIEKTVKYIHI